eukprot:5751987-Prymnesium_polylepis.2
MSLIEVYSRHLGATLHAKAGLELAVALLLVHPREFHQPASSRKLAAINVRPGLVLHVAVPFCPLARFPAEQPKSQR